jgi:hypothetical protein
MCKQATTDAADSTMPEVLNAVSEELHHLAVAVERLHDIVELPGVRDSLRCATSLNVLQGIDHVTQNLTGLSDFLTTLSAAVPEDWTLDTTAACDVVTIASLSERLKRPDAPRPAHSANDECEFF